jgi:hypothetical protein
MLREAPWTSNACKAPPVLREAPWTSNACKAPPVLREAPWTSNACNTPSDEAVCGAYGGGEASSFEGAPGPLVPVVTLVSCAGITAAFCTSSFCGRAMSGMSCMRERSAIVRVYCPKRRGRPPSPAVRRPRHRLRGKGLPFLRNDGRSDRSSRCHRHRHRRRRRRHRRHHHRRRRHRAVEAVTRL